MPFAVRTKNLKTPSLPFSATQLSDHVNTEKNREETAVSCSRISWAFCGFVKRAQVSGIRLTRVPILALSLTS